MLTHEWFTTIPAGAKASPLKRFYASFNGLSSEHGSAELALLTNRQLKS